MARGFLSSPSLLFIYFPYSAMAASFCEITRQLSFPKRRLFKGCAGFRRSSFLGIKYQLFLHQWCSEMVRAPCCEKMGLKRGPWTTEEDEVLISHINKYGHSNWRALPKQAGLLRCGKSCRLRWTNYLRPDIKRGNFTSEEEDTIIRLHSMLGNRWSAIAARLTGRTDNEIKNVWHTHLKKRLKQSNFNSETKKSDSNLFWEIKSEMIDFHGGPDFCFESTSPQPSSSATDASVISWETHSSFTSPQLSSSATDASVISWKTRSSFEAQQPGNAKLIPSIDRSFSTESSSQVKNSYHTFGLAEELKDELTSIAADSVESEYRKSPILDDCVDFWFDLLLSADELPNLPEI